MVEIAATKVGHEEAQSIALGEVQARGVNLAGYEEANTVMSVVEYS